MGNKLAIKKYIDRETRSKNKLFLDEESDNYLKEMYPKSINNDAESLYINKNLYYKSNKYLHLIIYNSLIKNTHHFDQENMIYLNIFDIIELMHYILCKNFVL